jgi:hypothetical protein
LAILVTAAILACASCREPPRSGTLYEVASTGVTVAGQPARAGQTIGFKDEVAVATKGAFARILLQDGTRIFLLPDPKGEMTRFTVDGYQEQASARSLVMRLLRGVATLMVPKNRPKADVLEVQASYTTTAIRGTELKIQTGPDGDTVSVKEGTVEVRPNPGAGGGVAQSKSESIGATEQIRFEAGKGFLPKGTYNPFGDGEAVLFRDANVPVKTTIEK